ncbi:hypothetical protein HK405_000492, partial [Cladochytrium tenue]
MSSKTVVIVTGSSRGIGAVIAKEIASTVTNPAIVVNYNQSAAGALSVVADIKSKNPSADAIAVQADLSTAAGAAKLVREAVAAFGHLDVLVNNAGTFATAPIGDVDEALYSSLFDSQVKATLLVTAAASAHLSDGASIVNIS